MFSLFFITSNAAITRRFLAAIPCLNFFLYFFELMWTLHHFVGPAVQAGSLHITSLWGLILPIAPSVESQPTSNVRYKLAKHMKPSFQYG
jgi:hypothetical protein